MNDFNNNNREQILPSFPIGKINDLSNRVNNLETNPGLNIGDAIGSLTAGSVLFGGTSGLMSQDNANFFWDDTNNRLGIGTTGPNYKLDVAGEINLTGYLRSNGTAMLWSNGSSIATLGTATAQDLSFYAGAADRMWIQASTGNVGIGTTSPNNKLTIQQDSTTSQQFALQNDTTTAGRYSEILFKHSNGAGQAGIRGYGVNLNSNNESQLRFFTSPSANSPTERMTIDQAGNIGIGTTSPGEKLEIAGNTLISNNNFYKAKSFSGTAYSLAGITSGNVIQIGAIDYISAGVTVAGGVNISFTTGGASGTERMRVLNTGEVNIALGLWKFTSGGLFEWGNNRGYLTWDTGYAAIRTRSGNRLDLGTDTSGIIMTLAENGNVGIGTTSPTAVIHLKAGTATASTAPLKFTSGTLLTTPEAGAVEFLSDAFYGTITTGGARKTFAFLESPTFTGTVTAPTITSTATIILKGYTVATLPTGTVGMTAYVTDALTPAFNATVVGGGAVVTKVFYDGTNWIAG